MYHRLKSSRKFTLLGGLYITQFLGLGFIITAVPAILRDQGASLSQISTVYTLGFIWSIKFLWAPLIDRFGLTQCGHYRGWLLLLQTCMILTLASAATFTISSQFSQLMIIFALFSMFSATQDIAADALGVNMLTPQERGFGNSIQIAGGFIGNLIGGGGVLVCYAYLGWQASLYVLAAATMLPLLNIWRYQEPSPTKDSVVPTVSYRDLTGFFKRPQAFGWMAIVMTYTLGISSAYALISPMLVDMNWSLDRIGFATSILGAIISIIGAVSAGIIMHYVERKLAMLFANVLVGIAVIALLPIAHGSDQALLAYFAIGLLMFAFGASSTMLATMMMDKSQPHTAGTDYTLQYSLSSMAGFVLSSLSLVLAENYGYANVLYLSLALVGIAQWIVWHNMPARHNLCFTFR